MPSCVQIGNSLLTKLLQLELMFFFFRIGSGSSHFGSGTLGLFKPISRRNLIAYSIKLYQQLQEMGYDIGLKQCGSINLAQTKDRMVALKRRMAYNVPTGLHCEVYNLYFLHTCNHIFRYFQYIGANI